ncbi:glycosyltransferase family 2 protein [Mucisphaera calidilacus]|uniref:GalNAc(5)-diNAcBac-PP-undecaprenol beta-1,3-glucosyltransferase n=1 Tax=Mucisphaera calidilacus TaxID=2527982 RepID=A0A518BZ22_9BACT|nr:glycosyltransferase family 2 protein [Mucisphaera calidilacus]QDU72220.1 GalNAc(5)-diNAcBac-PP-undecaprenol beta-1,3-glucosyltransferase [Mucisphaera calidilacus]
MTMPRLSVVIPSYNQAAYLAETIESVLGQGYDNLQLMVIDGGSDDGSVGIIERYRDVLDVAISEPDGGQTEAINKGLMRADGDLVTWVCSDDTLLPGSLDAVAGAYVAAGRPAWLAGRCQQMDASGVLLGVEPRSEGITLRDALLRSPERPFAFPQPGVWWDPKLHRSLGYLDASLHYCMDFAWWLRLMSSGYSPVTVEAVLATYRMHEASKTCAQPEGFIREHLRVERFYARRLSLRERWRVFRRTAYQYRSAELARVSGRPWSSVVRRPWWLLSQQVRGRLWAGDASCSLAA